MRSWFSSAKRLPLFLLVLVGTVPSAPLAFRDLGAPIREAMCWGAYLGPGKTGKLDTLYLSFGQYKAPLFLLSVHPETGETRQFLSPLSSEMGSWGWTLDRENRIYLGSYYRAHLLRFDPRTETWEDLGRPGGETESFICRLTTAPDGKIWGGTFPLAKLFSYDPKTGASQDFGRMADQFYCYPTAGDDGLIYCSIQFEKGDIVVFDPKTGSKTSLISPENRRPGRISLSQGKDGKIYAGFRDAERWFRIEEGRNLVDTALSDVPLVSMGLPDGRQFSVVDDRVLRIEHPVTKERKEWPLHYEASGAFLFVVGSGPDGRVYGSSMLPLRLFAYDPKTRLMSNLGRISLANGEVYSMAALDGKLYLCSYPDARLSVYDPRKPLRFGDREDSNPRDLGPMGGQQYRPRAMVAGPDGRAYIGSYPDYGLHGGAIMVYDPKREEKEVYRHVVKDQSIASLAYVEKMDVIAAGSSVRGGTGTWSIEKEAKFILWDPKTRQKLFETVPVAEAKTILSLAATKEGLVYGITDSEKVFVFDPERREVRMVFALGFKEPRDVSLLPGPEGQLYGLATEAIFAIDPKSNEVKRLAKPPVAVHSGMAIRGRNIYFGSGASLWEFEIPKASPEAGHFPMSPPVLF